MARLPAMTFPNVPDVALQELRAYAAQEGRNWKDRLERDSWWRGLPVRDFPHLYGLRNSHGGAWLAAFRFPEDMIQLSTDSDAFGTVDNWRSRAAGLGCRTWQEAMRRFALAHGKAVAMLGDDSARIVERDSGLKSGARVRTLPPQSVKWIHA